MSCYIATIKRNNFLTPFVNKSTYQPPKARKVSFFCNWRMQMRQRHERGLVLHSHATCRTQIYAEYTGGTIIIRLMHSTRGEHNLKLVGTGLRSSIVNCRASIGGIPWYYMRSLVILSLCYLSGTFFSNSIGKVMVPSLKE